MQRHAVRQRLLDPEIRRDSVAFFCDMLSFNIAMSFVSRTTVLPSLVLRLTGSPPLVGLVETICNGAWLLPQLLAARFLSIRSARKRYVAIPVSFQRVMFVGLAPLILLLSVPNPGLAAALLLVTLGVFYTIDAFASVAWFDLLTLAIPPAPRARLIGIAQLFSGVAGIGCGMMVGRILGSGGIPFPKSYALLFACASLAFLLGLAAILSFREHAGHSASAPAPVGAFLRVLVELLRRDRQFALVVGVRLLVGSSGLATPFYILYALEGLGLADESIGFFTAAQVTGGIASSLLMARLNSRGGPRAVIRLCAALALASPLVALLVVAARSGAPAAALQWVFAAVFVALGALANGGMAGFMSYLLEFAPPEHRTVYVGLANTLNGLVLAMPFIGGWILKGSSFAVLFAVTALVSTLGLLGSLRVGGRGHEVERTPS